MRRTNFFFRLFLGNLLLVTCLIAVGGYIFFTYLDRNIQRQSLQSQNHMLRFARNEYQQRWPIPPELIQREVAAQANDQYRLTVIDSQGNVLGDSSEPPAKMVNQNTPDHPEVLAALTGHEGQDTRRSDYSGLVMRYHASPILRDGKVVGLVRLAMPAEQVFWRGDFLKRTILWGLGLAVATAVLLGGLFSWVWYRPIRQVTATAEQLASGNLTLRPSVRGSTELADLASSLNKMRHTVSSQLETITDQRQNLQTILANLREGVIAIDGEQRIVFMNASARRLLATQDDEPAGKLLQSVVRVAEVIDAANAIITRPDAFSRQIETDIRGRRYTLSVHASRIAEYSSEGTTCMLVVHDITELARTASMKAEFVANASHELRTPLATLRAAVDSLLDIEPGDSRALARFIAMLDRNVARLENMTGDLLDLHIVEASRDGSRIEEVEIESLLWSARQQFGPRAREAGVELELTSNDDSAVVSLDRKMLVLILQNLLDNALKFTPSGKAISCDLNCRQGLLELRVQDTGCGIAPEDQAKVFDRFFQAETSRTGDTRQRGTGLGLAIVKHAADRLGAEITLHSEVGRGTTVTVAIPTHQQATPAAG
jgi:two-component system, OmpR family, phosphate regulon sensor histidine kinase PhoR